MESNNEEKKEYLVPHADLSAIDGKMLYYPCSGGDLRVPIEMFAPKITTFLFVDRGYFCPGHQDTRLLKERLDRSAEDTPPLLEENPKYELISKRIVGKPTLNKRYSEHSFEPCHLYEYYRHLPTRREITVIRKRGFGRFTFREEVEDIGVFFHRGDSQGEGGSDDNWLAPYWIGMILGKLVDGGLIVTDGSNHGSYPPKGYRRRYRDLVKYHNMNRDQRNRLTVEPHEDVNRSFEFEVEPPNNNREFINFEHQKSAEIGSRYIFNCVGYAGWRYGPTFVWQTLKQHP